MLEPAKLKSNYIHNAVRKDDCLYLYSEAGMIRVTPKREDAARITFTCREAFSDRKKPGVIDLDVFTDWDFELSDEEAVFYTDSFRVVFDRNTSAARYYLPSGKLLLAENPGHPRELEEFEAFRLAGLGTIEKEKVKTADGEKEIIRSAEKVSDGKYFHTRQYFLWQENEALYGLGQHEEEGLNLRGRTVYLHQANRKIVVPMLVSSAGYGILFDYYSPMVFSDNGFGSYLYCEAADEIDFYFMCGGMDRVTAIYRSLTGKASLLPRWAFGYVQSQERYENSRELTDTVKEFRSRHIGLDCIVQDWLSWPDGQWGQKSFDEGRYKEADKWLKELHDDHARFMISIWPNMAEGCENYIEFKDAEDSLNKQDTAEKTGEVDHLLLPGSNVYNALDERARALYWKQVNEGLYRYGVDAWWCDSSEPYTPEWMHLSKPEPGRMYEEYCTQVGDHLPLWAANSFALFHAQSLYEGQRGGCRDKEVKDPGEVSDVDSAESKVDISVYSEKRVINLTRSSYTGQQRYGTVLWSGDTAASWETLKNQITMGLNFSASGLPYWTDDIGAFFVKQGENWYWQGDYPLTNSDPAYCELYVRWFEWACFLPMLRAHGTDVRREPWHFTVEGGVFEQALIKNIRLRYSLLPYIYSLAGLAWLKDRPIIRMLACEWPQDALARECRTQFMLGDSMMICPVTESMYYKETKDCSTTTDPVAAAGNDINKTRVANITSESEEQKLISVYLPAGGWYDYHNGTYYEGGRTIEIEASLDCIPVFVRAGAVIPYMEPEEWAYEGYITDTKGKLKLKVYPGTDSECLFYDDAGDGYGYEKGEYRLFKFNWDDVNSKLDCELLHGVLKDDEEIYIPGYEVIK